MDEGEWVDLVAAAEEPVGRVHALEVGDVDLVVWRGANDLPCVMEARCPHQWSHLEAEGFVDGDEIVCAAHFWRFGQDGRGTKLNVKGRRDEKADIEVYPCREVEGRVQAALVREADSRG
jgi:phenylpropionate dioxygenase-like ring-hydroxylating dioxygenase large terminal subunit